MIIKHARNAVSRILCICALPLAACTILPAPTPVDVYLLPASNNAPARADRALRPWSLRIARPDSNGQLLGQRILVIREQNRLSVYGGANWNEPAALLMRGRLFDAFRADGRVRSLSIEEMRTFADYELGSELGAFQSEYQQDDKLPEAVIKLDTRLIDTTSRRIVAGRAFETRETATDSSVPAVVEAFGRAADRLCADLVGWVVAEADAAHRLEPAAESLPVGENAP
ncbi:MAG: ABC-type transport auxiliary lipoprotein family protein [Azoarcus sp.]|jgi:cholesterol transport system auxiliary component|nr:ABC-type transport auxiliary lipoprotein family protein [Azoarcus sp.]